ncbi:MULTISPECIES: hypothetical protein [unclassified Pseudoalteromonas]|uniref:hypothetical protein n=1 Tax=unclassified Pseudoalteromonas TaxID=194690 RepID=UPI0018F3B9AD|nr:MULTISPECIES: hypothetical protein [unclassified Pseudoalteromonas]MCK8123870.1 hypothetical protein [Pseudoalteromonas sp. 2CM39R]
MRYLLLISIILISGCSREHHPAIGGIQFSIEDANKIELIKHLDSFALNNNLAKNYEGGEQMLPEKAAVLVAAKYSSDDGVHIFVQNYLNHDCFFAAAYDFNKGNEKKARELAELLKAELVKTFKKRLTFYSDSQCKSAI